MFKHNRNHSTGRRRLSYANVMSTIAVFVAIGGTSYAAITLPRNSVGGREIKSRSVGAEELKRGAVRSRAIRNKSVTIADLTRATRSALAGKPGPPGPPGPAGTALRAAFSSAGGVIAGDPAATDLVPPNKLVINFGATVGWMRADRHTRAERWRINYRSRTRPNRGRHRGEPKSRGGRDVSPGRIPRSAPIQCDSGLLTQRREGRTVSRAVMLAR